jgi:hypothetical protein
MVISCRRIPARVSRGTRSLAEICEFQHTATHRALRQRVPPRSDRSSECDIAPSLLAPLLVRETGYFSKACCTIAMPCARRDSARNRVCSALRKRHNVLRARVWRSSR